MAEPAGLLVECNLNEKSLTALFKQKVAFGEGTLPIGQLLSRLLDKGSDADILIAHFDPREERLFLAWILTHYSSDALTPIWPVIDALAARIDPSTEAKGFVATTFPDPLESVHLRGGVIERYPNDRVGDDLLGYLSAKLWSFAEKGQFPDAERSMRSRNMQCKPFKSAWKTYLVWRDAEERPARIAAATPKDPYLLFGNIFTALGQVFLRDASSGRDIQFHGADPLTFRTEAGYYADQNHVWQRQLAAGSPPSEIQKRGHWINNREAIWEYAHVADAEGASFRWLFERWDTIFWRDAHRIYASANAGQLAPLTGVNAANFREFGQCFGTDGQHVYYSRHRLPLNAAQLQTVGIFIWDIEKVFCREFELPLRGEGFRILGNKRQRGSIFETYRLTDGDTTIILTPDMQIRPDDANF